MIERLARTSPASGRHAAGFTILELIIVLTLIGILAAMLLPGFGRTYRDAMLRSDARRIAAALSLAYSQSVTSGREHRLRIDGAEQRYWIELREDGGERAFIPAEGVPGVTGELSGSAHALVRDPEPLEGGEEGGGDPAAGRTAAAEPKEPEEGEVAAIAFRPDGTAEAREVLLEDADGFALAVRVHPSTSRIRVVPIDRKALP